MRAYPTDFRRKVVQAYEEGRGSQRHLARLFGVRASCVQELLQRYRQTGSVESKPHGGGNSGKVFGHLAAVERLHHHQPDASLSERGEQLAAAVQVRVSRMTMSRTLPRLQLTRKKRRFAPPSKTRPPDSKRGAHTSEWSRTSPPNR